MSDVIIYDRMQERRGTAANLASVNEVLRDGEPCYETDTTWPNGGGRKFKVGDGVTAWNSLPYAVPDTPLGTSAWTTVKKTADEARNTTTTLADDAALKVTLAATTRYCIRFNILYSIANATMDFKYAFSYSGTTTSITGFVRLMEAGTAGGRSSEWQEMFSALPSGALISSAAGAGYYILDITILTGTAGDLVFRWAQNTSNASNAIVLAGSYLEYMTL